MRCPGISFDTTTGPRAEGLKDDDAGAWPLPFAAAAEEIIIEDEVYLVDCLVIYVVFTLIDSC